MDFDLTEEEKMLKSNARTFLEAEIAPLVDEREKRGDFLSKEEVVSYIKKLRPLGYFSSDVTEEYGGVDLSAKSEGLLYEELNRVWHSLAFAIKSGHLRRLIDRGSEEQKKRFLPRLLNLEAIIAGALSEPNVGSAAPEAIETKAVPDGNEYVINGTKTWIGNGTIADIMIVMVKLVENGTQRLADIIVERDKSPYGVRELHKLGRRVASFAELSFEDCRVPKENVLEPMKGLNARQEQQRYLQKGRLGLAIASVGIAQAAVDASLNYVRERKQFGRPIGGFQLVQEMLVDMVTETEAARLLTYRGLDLVDKGQRCRWQASVAKAFSTEMGVRVTSKAIQIHGAVGVVTDYPIERYFRDARMLTIPDGTTQIHQLIAGRELTGIRALT